MNDLVLNITGLFGSFSMVVLLGLVIVLYLLPTIVAFRRKKRNRINIAFFNIVLGWTGIAWAAMIVEAFKNDSDP